MTDHSKSHPERISGSKPWHAPKLKTVNGIRAARGGSQLDTIEDAKFYRPS